MAGRPAGEASTVRRAAHVWRAAWLFGALACGDSADAPVPDGGGACGVAQACVAQDGGTPGDSGTPGDRGSPWVLEVARLDALLGAPGAPTVVDARRRGAFEAGHIAGAHSLDVSATRAEVDGVTGQVAPLPALTAVVGAAGLAPGDSLVVYGAESDLTAARLVWTLAYLGHPRVQLLDAGLTGWQAAGLPVQTGPPVPDAVAYPEPAARPALHVDVDWMLAHLEDPNVVLVDARSAAEYAGGHIPGAIHRDWQASVGDGALRTTAWIREHHREIPAMATVVTYCQTGARASMAWLVLKHLGYPDVRVYDGSMAEWTLDPERPLEP